MAPIKRQEINLYLPSLRPQIDPLAPQWAGMYAGVVLLLLLLTVAYDAVQNRSLNTEITDLTAQEQKLAADSEVLKAQLPKSRALQLDNEILEIRRQVERRQRIKGLVDAQNLGNAQGFSLQLQGMARQRQDGLALESFAFNDGGARVAMAGKASTAAVVPRYIERLQTETAFSDSHFGVMKIEQLDDSSLLSFELTPVPDGAEEVATQ